MKGKLLVGGILVAFVFLAFGGCQTPPPPPPPPKPVQTPPPPTPPPPPPQKAPPPDLVPLTDSILKRLRDSEGFNIQNCQLLLFGKISLEKVSFEERTTVNSGVANLENVRTRENITIHDKTEGQALRINESGGRIALPVCFEEEEIFQLEFSAISSGSESYFYLQFTPNESAAFDNVKGKISYGGSEYNLTFSGDRPYLLIRLSQKDINTPIERNAPGRRVAN
jgi:hypothetical protein